MTDQQAQRRERRTPILLKALLGKIHSTAREIDNPDSFSGIVFFTANKINRGRPDSYRVILNNSTELTQSQIDRIVKIVNSERPEDQQFVVETPKPPKRTRAFKPKKSPSPPKVNPEKIVTKPEKEEPKQSKEPLDEADEYIPLPSKSEK